MAGRKGDPMKIVLCTTPIRPVPTDYPPFGSMAIVNALRREGFDPRFYDIDGLRPSQAEVEASFREWNPDVVAVSAVVSTAYGYVKWLCGMLRRACPNATIVVGGNLAASAEILHRLAGVDYCVIGEGEVIARNLFRHLASRGRAKDEAALRKIPGLSFINQAGELVFTGYELPLPAAEVFEPDYTLLETSSKIGHFIGDPRIRPDFLQDARTHEPHRRGKAMGTLVTAKGCVARCTFCHRWDKGYRAIPVETLMRRIRDLKQRYNVGFIQFTDENFGSDKRHLEEFIEAVSKEDILYIVGGVRVRSVTLELLRRLKKSGLVALYYGMESGSEEVLGVMEKKASQKDNENAVRWTHEAGLYTIYQLVLGMPGENEETIRSTIDFVCRATEILPEAPVARVSVNYIQALPGTPVYEFARQKGLIGRSLEDEERYLVSISDIEASDDTKFINYTDCDYLTVQSWRKWILLEATHNYRKKHRLPAPPLSELWFEFFCKRFWPSAYARRTSSLADVRNDYTKGGYFNLQAGVQYQVLSAYLYPLRGPVLWGWLFFDEFRRLPLREFLSHALDHLSYRLKRFRGGMGGVSLRKTVEATNPRPESPSEEAMAPLRAGR
ncbi:B12-binding domain-containing radical SAM protein [bacterium]|nr:MAG: B12-binding domain-containing radical SAM protein [bacterium]